MAKTKKQSENSACSALFERAYYSSGYGNPPLVCTADPRRIQTSDKMTSRGVPGDPPATLATDTWVAQRVRVQEQ